MELQKSRKQFRQESQSHRDHKAVLEAKRNNIIKNAKPKVLVRQEVKKSTVQDDKLEKRAEQETSTRILTYQVYSLSNYFYDGRRAIVNNIGIDIGTKTIVVAFKGDDGKTRYLSEINGYWPFERATKFVENMLADPNKIRSDGTKRPARWIKLEDQIIVLGRDAEEFAYSKNDTLLRPMAKGGVTGDEQSMVVLSSIVQGLLEMVEKDLGKFDGDVDLCYCTTANAINGESNIDYHERVVDMIIDGYETSSTINRNCIKESHAIVLEMDQGDGTGIGISWGAGTVTVSIVKYGLEVYSFCYIGAGDWIDTEVAMRHGYNPEMPKKKSSETPTTVAKRKMDIDLTPGKTPSDRVGLDIMLHYDVLINKVVDGIIAGFEEHESEARIDDSINIYMAGGTSSPKGFTKRVKAKFDESDLPFTIGSIKRSDDPLFTVASGCLKASEYGIAE